MLRPVHFTTIARAAPVAAVRRRRRVAGGSDGAVESDMPRDEGVSPFEAGTGSMAVLRAAGAPTTPAFRAALLKLAPGGG